MPMGTVAVGDVHGNSAALSDLLDRLVPDLTRDDCSVFLGDYIDRGSDTKGCIDQILQFQDTSPGPVITLMGNHEGWLLRTYQDRTRHLWILGMEAFETMRSYSQQAETALRAVLDRASASLFMDRVRLPYEIFLDQMPAQHLSFLKNLTAFRGSTAARAGCAHGHRRA